MKAIKIKNAGQSFGIFLIGKGVDFLFHGAFYILNISRIDELRTWCIRSGFNATEVEQMEFSIADTDEII